MNYFKYIEIDNFELIQHKTLNFLTRNNWMHRIGFEILPFEEYLLECPEIITAFNRYDIKPILVATYIMVEQDMSRIHIDYKTSYMSLARINIPIVNCEGSSTEFYDIPLENFYATVQSNGLKYFTIKQNVNDIKK